jgi:hypothetical protein
MVISWIVLAIGQLSVAGLPLVGGGPDAPGPAIRTPGEPSTIFEAMIGISLVAVYLMFARRMRSRRGVRRVSTPRPVGSGRKAA